MVLTLSVENVDRLPDGGPLSIRVERHGIDIGRNAYLDWTLPDDSRHISGRHCEVRYENGRYLLYDISTNGTFVNGSENRVQSPYELRDGDELEIGRYIISVRIEGAGAAAGARAVRAPSAARDDMQASFAPDPPPQDVWAVENNPLAPPISADDLRPKAHKKPVQPDFLEWVVDPLSPAAVRPPAGPGTGPPSGAASEPPGAAFGWANDPPPPPPPDVWTVEPPPPPPPAGRDDPWPPAARPPAASGEDAWRVEPSPPPSRPAASAASAAPSPPAKGAPAEPAGGAADAGDAGGTFAGWRAAPEAGKPFDPAAGAPGLGERAERQVAASGQPDAAGEPYAAWPPDAGGGPAPVGPGADEPRQRAARTASASAPPMPAEAAAGTATGDRSGDMEKLIDGLAEATGLSPEAFADLPPDELGRMLGRFMLLTLENLKDLLDARASAKTLARSTRRTMVQAVDNNPVKFLPTAADALKVVLNDRINGYLPYDRALTESFNDIKQHQVETYAAMRYALSRLVEEISPETIERETPSSGGLMQNKDARQWRTFLTKWKAMAAGQDGGMNERFMMHFAEFYDRER